MINKDQILADFYQKTQVKQSDLKGLYVTGSWQYGCANKKSDIDLTAIVSQYPSYGSQYLSKSLNVNFYLTDSINRLIEQAYIPIIEAYYSKDEHVIIQHNDFDEKKKITNLLPNMSQLRTSVSTLTSHSWVKGKKKLTTSDYEPKIALKSIFHSIRIQDLIIQLLDGTIHPNYGSCNYILTDLYKINEKYHRHDLWDAIKTKYYPLYKKLKSEIKQLIPKEDLNSFKVKNDLVKVLTKHNVNITNKLLEDLIFLM